MIALLAICIPLFIIFGFVAYVEYLDHKEGK